jgi:thioredoxin 1
MMKKILVAAALSAAVIAVPVYLKRRGAPPVAQAEPVASPAAATARRLPRLVDLGTTTCAPCKAMLVVIGELERSYADQLGVEFVNVQQQQEETAKYGVKIIPTQVFLDPDGKELFRHAGFYGTEAIVAKWRELGYPLQRRPVGG